MSERHATAEEMTWIARRWRDVMARGRRRLPSRTLGVYTLAIGDGGERVPEWPSFVVATAGGEAMTLTHGMLRSLARQPLTLCGEVIVTIEAGDRGVDAEPVASLSITMVVGHNRRQPADYVMLSTTVEPADLVRPLTITTTQKPEGWPW